MSVALENARLFDETQRLLKETEKRATELRIINSVQEGLAQKPDTASIYDLVGNKIRELYPQADLFIGKYESGTCLLYTSDAADDLLCVDLGGRRIIKKKKK